MCLLEHLKAEDETGWESKLLDTGTCHCLLYTSNPKDNGLAAVTGFYSIRGSLLWITLVLCKTSTKTLCGCGVGVYDISVSVDCGIVEIRFCNFVCSCCRCRFAEGRLSLRVNVVTFITSGWVAWSFIYGVLRLGNNWNDSCNVRCLDFLLAPCTLWVISLCCCG